MLPSCRDVQQHVDHLRELSGEHIHTGSLPSPLVFTAFIHAGILFWRMLCQALTAVVWTVLFAQSWTDGLIELIVYIEISPVRSSYVHTLCCPTLETGSTALVMAGRGGLGGDSWDRLG